MKFIISLDQGTTSCRAILFSRTGKVQGISQKEFRQIHPKQGWVEHDPADIWNVQSEVLKDLIKKRNVDLRNVAAIGIANQRETTIVWNRYTGKPVYNAIVWQCRRTAAICDNLKRRGLSDTIHQKTGLIIDAYFSATKIKWILDNVDGARQHAEAGELLFGTVDTYLIWKLTGGKVHATDYTNASRTMLFNLNTLEWDKDILKELNIPELMLPEVKPSSYTYGYTEKSLVGAEIPIAGIAGDQQAALFGQQCLKKGEAKNTYGTGCFMLMNIGEIPLISKNGLLTTIAWGINDRITYALEGSIFMAGAVVQWLRDDLRLIADASETETLAESVEDSKGIYLVPAFQGLGTPYWDMYARGGIVGLTQGVKKEHVVRAALESTAYRTRDVAEVMEEDSGIPIKQLRVDGGACKNNFLLQFQSDILGIEVARPQNIETTALGATFLAGLETGMWQNTDELSAIWTEDCIFTSKIDRSQRDQLYKGWKRAIERFRNWSDEGGI